MNHRFFIAMVYRRADAAGETLPAGLDENDPRVGAAIYRYGVDPRQKEQLRERKAAEGTPEYVRICCRQIRENIAMMAKWPGEDDAAGD